MEYHNYLRLQGLSEKTIEDYKNCIRCFKQDRKLKGKSRNRICQTKNAVKYYLRMKDIYIHEDINYLNELMDKAPKTKKKKESELQLRFVWRRINAIRDTRKKLAFRLQLISGLRIKEIEGLKPDDIIKDSENRLIIHVNNGKGGKSRTIKTIPDKYIFANIEGLKPLNDGRLFFKESTMIKEADKLGFHTHDLRKVFAQYVYNNYCATEKERIELLQRLLGHEVGSRTYLKYINRKINTYGTRF